MLLDELKALTADASPQKQGMITVLLNRIHADIEQLKTAGWHFHLEPLAASAAALQFPTMVYKDGEMAVLELLVHSSDELQAALAEGYRRHPSSEAQPTPLSAAPVPPPAPPAPTTVVAFSLHEAVKSVGATPSSPVEPV